VPVNTLKTGNNRRDRDLVKTMEAAIFPNIRFELSGVSVEWERGDSAGVVLEGRFVIHGVSRAEKVRTTVVRSATGVHLRADLPMNLHDYKVNNLKRFLVLKMNADILVHLELTF
jgi:polyisoprenoid-binding protein YceI